LKSLNLNSKGCSSHVMADSGKETRASISFTPKPVSVLQFAFLAGADPCDIMQVHEVRLTAVYYSA
jgi:hypothetical protein